MKKLILFLSIAVLLVLSSCTDNQRAKGWGGTMNIYLPADEEFINATFKNADLWVITKNQKTGVFYMHEYSSWGILNGTVVIK